MKLSLETIHKLRFILNVHKECMYVNQEEQEEIEKLVKELEVTNREWLRYE